MVARPPTECARRPGASPLKRMAASWSGSNRTQPNTRSRREASRAMAGSPRLVPVPCSTLPNSNQGPRPGPLAPRSRRQHHCELLRRALSDVALTCDEQMTRQLNKETLKRRSMPTKSARLPNAHTRPISHIIAYDPVHAGLHHICLRSDKSVSRKIGGSSARTELGDAHVERASADAVQMYFLALRRGTLPPDSTLANCHRSSRRTDGTTGRREGPASLSIKPLGRSVARTRSTI